jgi:hypothetical protein
MLSEKNHKVILPEDFKRYFWDVAFDDLSFEKYPRFIAERLLNYGDLNGIRWLLAHADTAFIRTLVDSSRNLNAKTKNYWQIMLTGL